MGILNPTWTVLSMVALAGGVLIILAPKFMVGTNKRLSKVMVSMDDLIMRHRHVVGVLLLVVSYLCFRLAVLLASV